MHAQKSDIRNHLSWLPRHDSNADFLRQREMRYLLRHGALILANHRIDVIALCLDI